MGILPSPDHNVSELSDAIDQAARELSLDQEITFQPYTRVVLPVDGYVFWKPSTAAFKVKGSLHFTQAVEQNEEETFGLANVLITTRNRLVEFETMPPNKLYVGQIGDKDGEPRFRFTISAQNGRYRAAGLWHYSGRSVSPALSSQLLDKDGTIDASRAVVCNSLPLWLDLNTYVPLWAGQFKTGITLYPSDLVEPNLKPPYGIVHIGGNDTRSLQSAPYLDSTMSSWQLAADRVRVTLYGLQSDEAIAFHNAVLAYSRDTDNFGIMNMPIPRDEKRIEPGMQAIAMKKSIDYEVSYVMSRVAQIARQLIKQATIDNIYLQ